MCNDAHFCKRVIGVQPDLRLAVQHGNHAIARLHCDLLVLDSRARGCWTAGRQLATAAATERWRELELAYRMTHAGGMMHR